MFKKLLLGASASTLALVGIAPANAAYPGTNGNIIFVRSSNSSLDLVTMDSAGNNETPLRDGGTLGYSPVYSPDGTKVAYQSNVATGQLPNGEIFIANADGSGVPQRLTTNYEWDWEPTWSPDGTRIAFVRSGSSTRGTDTEIWIMDVTDVDEDGNGDNAQRLTNNNFYDDEPTFSVNGVLAFTSTRDGNNRDIYSMIPGSDGAPVRLTSDPSLDMEPAWAPDGTWIAFSSWRTGNIDIYADSADGSSPATATRLTNSSFVDASPTFSPDWTKIAFRSSRSGDNEIHVMNVWDLDEDGHGDNVQQLTDTPDGVDNGSPDWQRIPPPANDDFGFRFWIPTDATRSGTTLAATRQGGEPDHLVSTGEPHLWDGDHTVWYQWKALGSGVATIDTCSAAIDSILAVYKGSSVTSLERVAENNNGCESGWGSMLSFEAVAGTKYPIVVGDAGGAREGSFEIHVDGPPNEPPRITQRRPVPGSSTTDRTPLITAKVEDSATRLGRANVDIWLDGVKRQGLEYKGATKTLSLKAPKLDFGKHEVKVVAVDAHSAKTVTTWGFRVVD